MFCVPSQLQSKTLTLPTIVNLALLRNGVPNHRKTALQATNSFISNPNLALTPKPSLKPLIAGAIGGPDQVCDGGDQDSGGADSSNSLIWAKPLLNFATTNFLPIALVSGVALGLANPTLGCLAHRYSMSKFSTFGIFLISGLTLRSEEIGAATEAWPAALFGLV
ncbi:hypothetical protein Scep_015251 [Stephania cephalantha]|uniref:Uncharacterized protein n=1 Tax=Stephania cephalantha TaxID=152367 RepID=A0AAP0J495_9MAGN